MTKKAPRRVRASRPRRGISRASAHPAQVPPSGRIDWAPVVDILRRGERFVLTGHSYPDGDVLGSELATARFLRSLGKDARCINCGIIPQNYRWMYDEGEIEIYDPARHGSFVRGADAILVFDYANLARLDDLTPPVRERRGVLIGIDHHPLNGERPPIDIVDLGAAAVGEMVYDLIGAMGGAVTKEVAIPLFVAITTDTGSFRYSNTTGFTHRLGAHLVDLGVEPYEVYRRIYEASSEARLRMLADALRGLKTDADGRLAWITVTRKMLDDRRLTEEETEGFIDVVRTLRDAEISMLVKEVGPGRIKVSLRSRGAVDVAALLKPFGGGGHARAAGVTILEPLEVATAKILAAARKALGMTK
ncbi:MAG: DHH family phosphoesterase [Planctomycetes bacterium]|nr:DHH family phosphoesterase [Planctomycetota bacterium]